jgi:hypothetical protein
MFSKDYSWKTDLTNFSRQLISNWDEWDEDDELKLSQEIVDQSWLGYDGATEAQLLKLEDKIGTALPTSYREFLKTTNGWRACDWSGMRLFGTEEIDWLLRIDPFIINHWKPHTDERPSVPDDKYFIYGKRQDSVWYRAEYLQNALSISTQSNEGDVYLLIPDVITDDGEWEAWHLGYKIPGANRYRSFYELMEHSMSYGQLIW